MSKCKFTKKDIGKKIIAHRDAPYSTTTNGWVGTLTKLINIGSDDIIVDIYCVQSKYFDLYSDTKSSKSGDFKVGDRVKVISTFDGLNLKNKTGTVVGFNGSGTNVGVEFDDSIGGHTCNGKAKDNHGRWGKPIELELIGKKSKKKSIQEIKINLKHLEPLIITPTVKDEIIAVLKQHENKDTIFTKWGLDKTIEYGKGMGFLFYGKPGTGKTFAAHCIAKALGQELQILSAAEIQTSEPGGANRNITGAFSAAKKGNKVLLLDECDSLIFDRATLGMILGSEVNTLLTEIEKFEGVVILSTNRIAQMDEALERRVSLIIEFPEPTYNQRIDIWKALIPSKMPLEAITYEELAKPVLTGGLIKNAVLQAARLAAASKSKSVKREHFESAILRIKSSKSLMGRSRIQYEGGTMDKAPNTSRSTEDFLGAL